jgi:hypothetical protein
MAEASTPTMTSGVAPPAIAAWNTANFPVKPEVSGMPANVRRNSAKMPATTGERLPRPAQRDRWSASPPESRTRVITANAPIVVRP